MTRQTKVDDVLDLYPEEMQPTNDSQPLSETNGKTPLPFVAKATEEDSEEELPGRYHDRRKEQYELITRQLDQALDRRLVKQRKGYGEDDSGKPKMLSYLEHHTITRALNRIFGYGKWGAETIDVHDFLAPSADDGIPRAVRVTVRLSVAAPGFDTYSPITKTGYAVVRPKALWENGRKVGVTYTWGAYEMALGNAEAKAFKRAAAQYGDQFGLSLYSDEEEETTPPTDEETTTTTRRSSSTSRTTNTSSGHSSVEPQGGAPRYADNESAECEECGKEIKGYTNRQGKTYTTQDLVNMSWKQSNGHVLCLDCRRN